MKSGNFQCLFGTMLDTDDDTVMEDVPLASSTQTTDQILGFADIEGEENGG